MYVLLPTFPTGGRKGHDFGDLGIKLSLGKIHRDILLFAYKTEKCFSLNILI
jgi:hypothetical protein